MIDKVGIYAGMNPVKGMMPLNFADLTPSMNMYDNISNNKAEESTGAEADFHAQGLIESVEKTITNTKVPRIERTRLTDINILSGLYGLSVKTCG